jgi:dTMP kinase
MPEKSYCRIRIENQKDFRLMIDELRFPNSDSRIPIPESRFPNPDSRIPARGLLIVLEGIDGTGKTTMSKRLTAWLNENGRPAVLLKEPTDGPFGRKIRALAREGRHTVSPEEELELFIMDRIGNCRDNIRPALEKGRCVVLDRYYLSSAAYQGALGLDPETILKRNEEIAVIPDLVLLMDMPVKSGLERISTVRKSAHDHFEGEEYLEKVRAIFLGIRRPFIRSVDASRDPESVFKDIVGIVSATLKKSDPGL